MTSFEYVITDPVGIHARPAGNLAKEAKKYACSIKITRHETGKSAEAKKLMALMGLGVKQGETVTVAVEGDDEANVAAQMEAFFKANL